MPHKTGYILVLVMLLISLLSLAITQIARTVSLEYYRLSNAKQELKAVKKLEALAWQTMAADPVAKSVNELGLLSESLDLLDAATEIKVYKLVLVVPQLPIQLLITWGLRIQCECG